MRKKWIAAIVLFLLLVPLSACQKEARVNIGLIVTEDGGFDQSNNFLWSAWEGVQQYAGENGRSCRHYEPEQRYEGGYNQIVDEAVHDGADILIMPGYLLEPTVFTAQDQYPDVRFVMIDGVPNNGDFDGAYAERVGKNTYSILYAEEQAGFLAGYAVVQDGFRKLGFFGGMSVPAVKRFGYGFIQGAEYAAKQLGLPKAAVELKYIYCGSFTAAPKFQSKAAQWYFQGTEVIFACGGAVGNSVIQAAEQSQDKWVVGVDTDQSGESDTVITSALKMISGSVYNALTACYNGEFPGGTSVHLGINAGGVGLAMETSRFRSFNQDAYDTIYEAMANDKNGITSGILKDDVELDDIPTNCVTVLPEDFN